MTIAGGVKEGRSGDSAPILFDHIDSSESPLLPPLITDSSVIPRVYSKYFLHSRYYDKRL